VPAPAIGSIVVAALLAAALVAAVSVILAQLLRTAGALDDIDALLVAVPPALAPAGPAIERANAALARLSPGRPAG
jgi:hypothetical protein